jgi:hypothetical protein
VHRSHVAPIFQKTWPFVASGLVLCAACTGYIGSSGAAPQGSSSGSNGGGGTGGSVGSGNAASPSNPSTPSDMTDPNAAGVMPLMRLTNREYDDTVHDLLGDTTQPATQFASDRDPTFEFRRAGDLAEQDATLLETAAESLAAAAIPNLNTMLPCASTGGDACAQQFITQFGQRAFRRPLSSSEASRLMALYTTGRTTLNLAFPDAISLLIEAMLQSPQFLYHWEVSPTDAPIYDGSVLQLGAYQIASRLSYFIWGSMPDDTLFAAAASGELNTVAGVTTAARRLLADPKARGTVSSFFSDWLALDGLAARAKDTTLYPQYTPALQAAMLAETSTFVQTVVFDGDGRWSTLLGAPYSYIDQSLGTLYGAQVVGTGVQRTMLNPSQRAGFLTQGSFLALTGTTEGSDPPRRGQAVLTKLLCRPLPPPPANVPPAAPASAGGTTRERFTEHDMNPCAQGCHTTMDPIGFAFENYDGIGGYRTTDNGLPVDASGSLSIDGAKQSFNDAIGLVQILTKSSEVRQCFSTEWARYALDRPDTPDDQASLAAVALAFSQDTAGVQDLMTAVATMRSFRYRSPAPGEMP